MPPAAAPRPRHEPTVSSLRESPSFHSGYEMKGPRHPGALSVYLGLVDRQASNGSDGDRTRHPGADAVQVVARRDWTLAVASGTSSQAGQLDRAMATARSWRGSAVGAA